MQASPELSQYPSFARTNLTEIAARVVEEFTAENEIDSEFSFNDDYNNENHENQVHKHDDEDDSEFAFVTEGSDQFSPISADEIFFNGQIRPIFNRDLSFNDTGYNNSEKVSTQTKSKSNRVSLRKLFTEDREIASSSSSSEGDDLEGIAPGTYCVWRPKSVEESPCELRKKSNSTGSSSKRWKLSDFIHRSNSDGKETFVFLKTPFKKREEKTEITRTDCGKITGKVPAVEDFPALRCSINGKDKRKSYLPYRQDLLSFLGNVNGLNQNLQHF
ncbi:hypothetical protein RDI58_016250 [Solanum bulbocastanum]|uniref:Uncharacterized protein n=1 Tax=Solanum bulbocastanum TaxID=147425 RepID=A0AAN8TIH6_SOLBU